MLFIALLLFLVPSIVVAMDVDMQDAGLQNGTVNNSTQVTLYWKTLRTVAVNTVTNEMRKENLDLVINNLKSNIRIIQPLVFIPKNTKELIVEKLFSIRDSAEHLKDALKNINGLAPENQSLLENNIDQLCHKEFDKWSDEYKRQVEELAKKQGNATKDDYQQLLNLFSGFDIKQ